MELKGVEALLFDVFGTVVDWRSTVSEYLYAFAHATVNDPAASLPSVTRAQVDTFTPESWATFAQDWRDAYFKFTRSYDPAEHGGQFVNIDEFHAQALRDLLQKYNIPGFWDEDQIQEVTMIWHKLRAWPDSVEGLDLLRRRFDHLATLSNGNTSLLRDLAGRKSLNFTDILSAEDFGMYKPRKEVYEGAAKKLGLETSQCAMVAAHLGDLKAAKGTGMKTIYVERNREEAWSEEEVEKAKREGWVDVWVEMAGAEEGDQGFLKLAKSLDVY